MTRAAYFLPALVYSPDLQVETAEAFLVRGLYASSVSRYEPTLFVEHLVDLSRFFRHFARVAIRLEEVDLMFKHRREKCPSETSVSSHRRYGEM